MQVRSVVGMMSCFVVALAAVGAAQQPAGRSVSVLAGDTRVTTAPDGLTVVVSVDFAGNGAAADGIVDEAFRVQLSEPGVFDLAGPATVVFSGDRLTVTLRDGSALAFAVAGKTKPSSSAASQAVQALGLSRFWGAGVRVSHQELGFRLLSGAGTCTTSLYAPMNMDSCGSCADGGGPSCSITCGGEGGCSATCSGGTESCCSCGGCRCCRF